MIKNMGSLTVCVVELEDCPEHKRPTRFACYVINRNNGDHLCTVLTNATFEGVDMDLQDDDNMAEIVGVATRLPKDSRDPENVRTYQFGPIFPMG